MSDGGQTTNVTKDITMAANLRTALKGSRPRLIHPFQPTIESTVVRPGKRTTSVTKDTTKVRISSLTIITPVSRLVQDHTLYREIYKNLTSQQSGGSLPRECSIPRLSGVESPPTQTTIVNSTAATNPFLEKNPIPLSRK